MLALNSAQQAGWWAASVLCLNVPSLSKTVNWNPCSCGRKEFKEQLDKSVSELLILGELTASTSIATTNEKQTFAA